MGVTEFVVAAAVVLGVLAFKMRGSADCVDPWHTSLDRSGRCPSCGQIADDLWIPGSEGGAHRYHGNEDAHTDHGSDAGSSLDSGSGFDGDTDGGSPD